MRFEFYRDKKAEWRWRCKAENNRQIADSSEGYHNKADALHAVNVLIRGAWSSEYVEVDK